MKKIILLCLLFSATNIFAPDDIPIGPAYGVNLGNLAVALTTIVGGVACLRMMAEISVQIERYEYEKNREEYDRWQKQIITDKRKQWDAYRATLEEELKYFNHTADNLFKAREKFFKDGCGNDLNDSQECKNVREVLNAFKQDQLSHSSK